MTVQTTSVMNAFETTLSAEFGATDLTMNIEEVTEFPQVPFYLVIDPLSENAGREYVFFDSNGSATSTSFTTSTLDNRYLARSSATGGLNHPAGTLVRMSPMEQHIQDLNDRVNTRLRTSDHTASAHNAMNLDHGELSGLDSGDPHEQYLTTGRHGDIPHSDKLTVEPTGRKMTVGTSPPSSPQVDDIWIDTN